MVHTRNVDSALAEELADIAEARGLELLLAEYRGGTLRLLLDRADGGVQLADCEMVSREASALLDVADFGRGRYTLEVSSPGLDRELFGPADYERFLGHLARMTHRDRETGQKRTDLGRLESFQADAPGGGEITLITSDGEQRLLISLDDVQKARLEIEL